MLGQAKPEKEFDGDASTVSRSFASQAGARLFRDHTIVEGCLEQLHLPKSKTFVGDVLGGWSGLWEGNNASGHITAYAGFREPLGDPKQDHFWASLSFVARRPCRNPCFLNS